MFKAYFTIAQAIKKLANQINWIDLDKDQLDNPELYNSIITPGILIGHSELEWSQLAGRNQLGNGTVTVKLVVRLPGQTHLTDPFIVENLKSLDLSDLVNQAVLSVPGVLSRVRSLDYPSGTYYVFEQTYMTQFKSSPTITQKTVSLVVNPFLHNPTANA
ncbi:hypothetical protein [Spirosoma lituiforme]